ncbi:hypothetical protein QTP88_006914 [Uroleucon formosanum]
MLGNVFCSFYTLIVFISFDVKEFKVLLCKICTLKIYVEKLAFIILHSTSFNTLVAYTCVGGVMVTIVAFQAVDPGSIPGHRSCLFAISPPQDIALNNNNSIMDES